MHESHPAPRTERGTAAFGVPPRERAPTAAAEGAARTGGAAAFERLQRSVGNRAAIQRVRGGIAARRPVQRQLDLQGDFNVEDSMYQQALIALYREDMKDLTPEEVSAYGLLPLIQPLLPKLLTKKNTTLHFSTAKPKSDVTGAVTELFASEDGGSTWHDVDKGEGRALLQQQTATHFKLSVVVAPGKKYPPTYGELVEIITHELSAHAEDFADLIEAYWAGGTYALENQGSQHERLKDGENARYEQLSARMRGALSPDDADDFAAREEADKFYMNTSRKPPVAFDFS